MSWTKEVTVFLGDTAVQLLQDWVVKVGEIKTLIHFYKVCLLYIFSHPFLYSQVNGDVVTLPFLMEPYIYIERQTQTVLLNTNIGLKVIFVFLSLLQKKKDVFVTLFHCHCSP